MFLFQIKTKEQIEVNNSVHKNLLDGLKKFDSTDKIMLNEYLKKLTPYQNELLKALLPQFIKLGNKFSVFYRPSDIFTNLFEEVISQYNEYKNKNPNATIASFANDEGKQFFQLLEYNLLNAKTKEEIGKGLDKALDLYQLLGMEGIKKLNKLYEFAQNPFNNLDVKKVDEFVGQLVSEFNPDMAKKVIDSLELDGLQPMKQKFGKN
ncbi:MAG: hypothetical protein ACK4J0_01690 [Candidatus Anstonellaceae archaeon]